MACPACGYRENPAGANFCENCGAPLPAASGAGSGPAATPSLAVSVGDAPLVQPTPAAEAPPTVPLLTRADMPTVPPGVTSDEAKAPPALRLSVNTEDAATQPLSLPETDPSWSCRCGQVNPAAETYCEGCGELRQTALTPLTPLAPLEPGDRFAGFEIVARTAAQSFTVRREAGEAGITGMLVFGASEQLADNSAVLMALGPSSSPDAGRGSLVPAILAEGTDPARGAYLVSGIPQGELISALDRHDIPADQAVPVLQSLLLLAERAAAADRLLLISPATVMLLGTAVFVPRPAAPPLPLSGPLLADPAYLPPELLADEREVAAWPANAQIVALTVRVLTGNALGYPPAWHSLMQSLLAADPAARPASRADALALLATGTTVPAVTMHRTAFRTDIGHHHPVNQDAGGVWTWHRWDGTPVTLAVVADGVSAGSHSEDAAALAVEAIRSGIERHWADRDFTLQRAEDVLLESGILAQEQVCALPMQSTEDASATTLVAVCLIGNSATGIWCGDSRAYGVTPEGMRQLTKDHSWVNIMVDSGQMPLAQAKADRRAHVIARWLGCSEPPRIDPGFDRFRCEFAAGDRLLLCSDGLYMYYDAPAGSEPELVETIYRFGDDAAGAVEAMVTTALERGGFDNITAVLVETS